MNDPHPDTVEKVTWMFMGFAAGHLIIALGFWLFMRLAGIDQINLLLVLTP